MCKAISLMSNICYIPSQGNNVDFVLLNLKGYHGT